MWEGDKMIIVAVVETGNYMGRGAEYVRNLYAMVKRNSTVDFTFVVITDDPMRHIPMPRATDWDILRTEHDGWWAKMDLFKAGTFPAGARVVYFDLDTIIAGNINNLLRGHAPNALRSGLPDTPAFLGNWRTGGWPLSTAAMIFVAGELDEVYEEWRRQGWPITRWGDDEFVRNAVNKLHINWRSLQHEYPFFASYKFHKLGGRDDLEPQDKIICFVQRPKPHDLTEAWAKNAWNDLQPEATSPMIDETVSASAVPPLSAGAENGEGAATPSPPSSKE